MKFRNCYSESSLVIKLYKNQWEMSWLQVTDIRPNGDLKHKEIYGPLTRNKESLQDWFRSVSKTQALSFRSIILVELAFCSTILMELAFLPLGFISCLEDCWQHSKAGCGGRMDDNQLLYSSVSYQKPITKAKSFMCGIVYLQVAGVMSHAGL